MSGEGGGYDLVGMTGVILGAASCGLPVVLDGFLSYASAPPAAWPRRRTLILFLHTCRRRKGRRSPSTRWVCGRISIWTCAGRERRGAMHLLDAASVMYNQMGTLAQSNIVLPDSAPSS